MHRTIVAFLLATSLSAAAQAPKPLPATPGNFQFTGTWDCTGAFGNGRTHRSTFMGTNILANKWLELTEQDVEPATGYLAKYLIGYDAQAKQLVEFDANNFGAATYSSPTGWQNGTLTMTSPVSDDPQAPYAVNRFIYTVSAPDTFTIDWQTSKASPLNWRPSDHLVCKRHTTPAAPPA